MSAKHLLLTLTIILIFSGCAPRADLPDKTIKLNLLTDSWASEVPAESAHKVEYSNLDVKENQFFGPKRTLSGIGKGQKFFKLLKIINDNEILIQFDDQLVIVGEPISESSKQNPVIVTTEKTCFRTRTYDAGIDYCLKIIK
jgi:hypothetical protein